MTLGRPRAHWRVTDSTNERARELAAAGAPHGTLVTADEQTAGRGRQGRAWSAAPRDAVLMSMVLREIRPELPLAAAVAVCEALPGLDARIKWPNDVWVEGRKLAGILVEGRPQEGWAVLGIGLNVSTEEFPGELREIATSVRLAAGEAPPVETVRRRPPRVALEAARRAHRGRPRRLARARRAPRPGGPLGGRLGHRRGNRRLGGPAGGDR